MTFKQVYMSPLAFYSLFLSSVEFHSENKGGPQFSIIFSPLVIITCLNGIYLHYKKINLCKQFFVLLEKFSFGPKMGDFQKRNFIENTRIYCCLKLLEFPYMVSITVIITNIIFLVKCMLSPF